MDLLLYSFVEKSLVVSAIWVRLKSLLIFKGDETNENGFLSSILDIVEESEVIALVGDVEGAGDTEPSLSS